MPEPGEDAVLLENQIAISDSQPAKGTNSVVYSETTGRGPSQAESGTNVLLVDENLAQGPGGAITLGELQGDTALYKGTQVSMRIPVTNGAPNPKQFTANFFEDGIQFESNTRQVPDGETLNYQATRTKEDVGCYIYVVNEVSNEHRVCWLYIDPGRLLADPDTIWLGGENLETVLSLKVTVPDSEPNDIDVTVDFNEEGSQIATETQTISPGAQYRFSTSVQKSEEQTVEFTASITDGKSGITVETQPVEVLWTNDINAVIDLVDFEGQPRINALTETATVSVDAQNTYDGDVDYTLEFFEDDSVFYTNTKTVPGLERITYSDTRTKSSPGKFTYYIQDDTEINRTDEIDITWIYVSAGPLEANPQVTTPGNPITLTLTVSNPSSETQPVAYELEEDGALVYSEGKSIDPGNSYTFSTTLSYSTEQTHQYQGFIQDSAGIRAPTNTVTASWLPAGIYADWGPGLVKIQPTVVSSFSDWYGYDVGNEARHGDEIRGRGSVIMNYDGSDYGITITYDDGTYTDEFFLEADTSFTEDVDAVVQDDPEGPGKPDFYNPQGWHHEWGRSNTDGGVAKLDHGFDIVVGVGLPGFFHNEGVAFSGSIRFVDNT